MTSPKHCNSATSEGNGIDIIYTGKLEIHTVLTDHCGTYTVQLGPLVIVLYLGLKAKHLDTSVLDVDRTVIEKKREKYTFSFLMNCKSSWDGEPRTFKI